MKVFFMHVPKTAGTSFRRFLERAVRERGRSVAERTKDRIWSGDSESYPSYDEFVSEAGAAYRACDLVCGHYPFHVRRLLPPETIVVTVLRDPLARCLSHVKHQMAYERATGLREPEPDLNAFLADPRNEMFLGTIGNLVVKYLASGAHPDAVVEPGALSLDLAVERCASCVFGFADELPEFQLRLAAELFDGAGEPREVRVENRSRDRFSVDDLTPRNRRLLEALNEAELELVRLMRAVGAARWEPRSAREGGALAAEGLR